MGTPPISSTWDGGSVRASMSVSYACVDWQPDILIC